MKEQTALEEFNKEVEYALDGDYLADKKHIRVKFIELLTKEAQQREELVTIIQQLIKSIEIDEENITPYQAEKIREAKQYLNK